MRDSLTSLSRLATGQLSLEQILTQVAEFAVRAIPGADGAGLTLLENNRGDTIVATAPLRVPPFQYKPPSTAGANSSVSLGFGMP